MTSHHDDGSRLGIAVVGCGQIVTHHLNAISSELEGKYIVRALVDPNAERRTILSSFLQDKLSDGIHPSQYASLDQIVADTAMMESIHIIFIAVPHDLHKSLVLRALTSNKIVVLEKPLAPTRDDCYDLVQVSQQLQQQQNNNSMLIIAEQSPYWQEVVMAKRLIQQERAIGTVISAAAYYYESMRDNVTSGDVGADGGLGWRASIARAGGGIAIDGGLHWIRPIREMCDQRIEKVVGVVRHNLVPTFQMEGETLGHALFEMGTDIGQPGGPLIGTYSCNMLATAPMAHDACPYFRITGDQGEIIIHGDGLFKDKPGSGGLRLYNEENLEGTEMFPDDRLGGFFLGFAGLWKEIHRICRSNDHEAAHQSVVRASDDVMVALALYASSKSRKWESTSF